MDVFWEKQPGTIARTRDTQFCRHGDKGMCDYCMPLEPYDSGYHAEHNIKHLSFHAYLRKQNIATNSASSATFVPPLEEAGYKVKTPCPSGQHPPWPAGVCTKCQPSAITLQRQPYRMVDHVEFAHPSLIERMLEIWRKTNAQRFGFLIGRYEKYDEVPMGVKVVVEAIHEPPQQGETDGLALGIPWEDQSRIEQLASTCGLQVVGMVYTDLEAADPTHTDARKAGLVACKRHLDSFFLSGGEAVFAAQLQGANRAVSRFSRSGEFNSRFVTCILTGNPEGVIDIAAYQVSEQAMGMADADMIEASVEPTTIRVKPSEGTRYVPEVFFRYKNKYGIDVKESAKPTFPVEYLIVNVGGMAADPDDARLPHLAEPPVPLAVVPDRKPARPARPGSERVLPRARQAAPRRDPRRGRGGPCACRGACGARALPQRLAPRRVHGPGRHSRRGRDGAPVQGRDDARQRRCARRAARLERMADACHDRLRVCRAGTDTQRVVHLRRPRLGPRESGCALRQCPRVAGGRRGRRVSPLHVCQRAGRDGLRRVRPAAALGHRQHRLGRRVALAARALLL